MVRNVCASGFCTKMSPARGAAPCGRNASAPVRRSLSSSRAQSNATRAPTGQPSSAKRMAGCSTWSSPIVPCAPSSASHAETAPGMVTVCGEVFSSASMPRSSNQSMLAAAQARPEPFNATTLSVPPGAYRQKQSPPMPVDCGSITPSTAMAATAASSALPPSRSTSKATSVAAGTAVAAMPWVE